MSSKQTTQQEARVAMWRGLQRGTADVVQQLERENKRLRVALTEIERISQRAGGVGQIARDALRVGT